MKIQSSLYLLAFVVSLTAFAQIDDARWKEIRAKQLRGDKVTEEERDYAESMVERKNQTESAQRNLPWAQEHPARESTGLVPLPDLGKGTWEGQQGGLYPGGVNKPPKGRLEAGLRIASSIVPLDRDGHPSPDGRIAMCTIGMSNTTQESRSFLKLLTVTEGVNPKVLVIDCAQGAQTASIIKNPNVAYWKMVSARIRNAEATPEQVQVVWMKEANGNPKGPVLDYARQLEADEAAVLNILHDKLPNLKIAYLSNRIYGGNAGSPLNPEPYAYASGFSVKWLIASQIEGKPELNYDPAKGAVRAPWIAWGPDLGRTD
jgi:hypothetical protein